MSNQQKHGRLMINSKRIERLVKNHAGPGAVMPDGTIFAGISRVTGRSLYTMPADAPGALTWHQAMEYAATLDAHGHQDWRVPTEHEVRILFINRMAVGAFNLSGSYPGGWYWSATENDIGDIYCHRFSDGCRWWNVKEDGSSLRCVRQ
jgi:hypothetical protein